MRSIKDTDKIIKENYPSAKIIYSLARKKVGMSKVEHVINAAVFLFTPFVRGVKTIHGLSDLGIYYFVKLDNKELLVRVAKLEKDKLIEEKDITGQFIDDKYTYEDDNFEKVREIQRR